MSDVRKSAARLYINNFVDSGRQNTIDILLVFCSLAGFTDTRVVLQINKLSSCMTPSLIMSTPNSLHGILELFLPC
jgi:hypothetical protein